jgi:hypothetical protein
MPTFEPSIENFGHFPLSGKPAVAVPINVDPSITLTSFDKVNVAVDKINLDIEENVSKLNSLESSLLTTQEQYAATKLLVANILTSVNDLQTLNQPRIDKLIANQDISKMVYDDTTKKLSRINYTNSYHEIFVYEVIEGSSKLKMIQHFHNDILKGETTLSYLNKKLDSLVFVSKG